MLLLFKCAYFMMPAYFANMAPVIMKKCCRKLAVPIDGGKNIFGNHKTYRGFVFGVLFAIIIAFLQKSLFVYPFFKGLSFSDYSNWLLLGFLLGFGALFGDVVKSFIKRRVKIAPGSRFFPWDQIDFVVGAMIFVSLLVDLSWQQIITIIVISIIGHIIVNHAAFYLGAREEKW